MHNKACLERERHFTESRKRLKTWTSATLGLWSEVEARAKGQSRSSPDRRETPNYQPTSPLDVNIGKLGSTCHVGPFCAIGHFCPILGEIPFHSSARGCYLRRRPHNRETPLPPLPLAPLPLTWVINHDARQPALFSTCIPAGEPRAMFLEGFYPSSCTYAMLRLLSRKYLSIRAQYALNINCLSGWTNVHIWKRDVKFIARES